MRNHRAQPGDSLSLFRGLGAAFVVLGAWAGIVPYAGPAFGYPMPPGSHVPAWQWTASHWQLHLAPGAAALIGGVVLLAARSASSRRAGSALALLGGAWLVLGPIFSAAWMTGMKGGGMMMAHPSVWMKVVTPLGYHYGTGLLISGLAAFALGRLRRDAVAPAHAPATARPGAVTMSGERTRVREPAGAS